MRTMIIPCLILFLSTSISAQIPPPGAEREIETMKELERTSFLDRDSVTMIDTIVLYDPETFDETIKMIRTRVSLRDYCTEILGINNPQQLLDGETITITNPETYEKMQVKWNHATGKIDTLRQ